MPLHTTLVPYSLHIHKTGISRTCKKLHRYALQWIFSPTLINLSTTRIMHHRYILYSFFVFIPNFVFVCFGLSLFVFCLHHKFSFAFLFFCYQFSFFLCFSLVFNFWYFYSYKCFINSLYISSCISSILLIFSSFTHFISFQLYFFDNLHASIYASFICSGFLS